MRGRDNPPKGSWVHVADRGRSERHSGGMTERQLTVGSQSAGLDEHEVDQFLVRYGDTIDDRIGEILDELLEERMRQHQRVPVLPLTTTVVAATVISLILTWYSPLAVAVVWCATAVICVSLTHAARLSKPR
ncbi:hypothetical protein GCM10010260_75880 [Streptomyces filipinensis]|uniref:Uncharacterized protein n=2 Tax=Streptomyces filipinensis TaxID=66887 RepID=A0A918IIU1_9ACTN|nr:hypothetical protein GCM10010260_75880 [Streptomyces filipinensis]